MDSGQIPVVAPTVAPPPGVRPVVQSAFPQGVGIPTIGVAGIPTLRPPQFNAGATGGLPLFQAQPPQPQLQSASSLGRRPSVERTKSTGPPAGPRKQCNCKNSRCLKLYCECFASGRYCDSCNCIQCYNNRENEATRQSAVEAILERNPNAFRPKIQGHEQAAAAAAAVVAPAAPGRHLKGCNCKKSFCLKKYCECFQAGIYCSDNCKCVDCKNYEEPSAGYGSGGSKRVRYSSAPPPQLGMSQPLGLPPPGPGFPGGILPAIRTGPLGALAQQPGGSIPLGLGLPPGIPGAAMGPLMAGGPGAARPGVGGGLGGLGGLGGSSGALATLPQALSLALAAAGNSQPGAPLLAAPSPGTAGQNGQAPARSGLFEVVNGMVKRHVIEELCSLLWLVADDEAARSRTGSGLGAAPQACTAAAPLRAASADGSGRHWAEQQPAAAVAKGAVANGAVAGRSGGGAAEGSDAGAAARLPSTGVDSGVTVGPGPAREDDGAGPVPMDADGGPLEASGTAQAAGPPAASTASCGGSTGAGLEPAGGAAGPLQPQPAPRPGPVYGRRERVVLEEFLSIINKIGDTAAKKLVQQQQQQAAGALPPPAGPQQQGVASLQFPLPAMQHPQLPQLPQQHVQPQFPQQQQQVLLAAMPGAGQAQPQPQALLQPPQGQPQSAVVVAAAPAVGAPLQMLVAQPSPGQSAGLVTGPAPGQPPLVRAPVVTGGQPPNLNGQAGAPFPAASVIVPPHLPGALGPHSNSGGVPIIRPPLPSGHASVAAGPHYHLHGDVPVIPAPPRSGHGGLATGQHPQQQQDQQQQHHPQQVLAPPPSQQAGPQPGIYAGQQVPQAAVLLASPFVPAAFGTTVAIHGTAAAPQPQPVDPQQPLLHLNPQSAQASAHDVPAAAQQSFGLQQLLADDHANASQQQQHDDGAGGSLSSSLQIPQQPQHQLGDPASAVELLQGVVAGDGGLGYVDGVGAGAGHPADGS